MRPIHENNASSFTQCRGLAALPWATCVPSFQDSGLEPSSKLQLGMTVTIRSRLRRRAKEAGVRSKE